MATKQLMDNYEDLSQENGFQFQFYCECCGYQQLTSFQKYTRGALGNALANSLGGFLGSIFETRVEKKWRDKRDNALLEAQEEVAPKFKRCGSCSSWVCESCWVPQESCCKDCSVVMEAQSTAEIVGQAAAAASQAFRDPEGVAPPSGLICPSCSKPAGQGKFCQECGAPLGAANCPACGKPLSAGVKFCGECGHKIS